MGSRPVSSIAPRRDAAIRTRRGARRLLALGALLLLGRAAAAVVPGSEGLEVVAQDLPLLMAGTPVEVALLLRNDGATTWAPAADFNLSYHWLDPAGAAVAWDGLRTALPHPVAPGERVRLRARLETPAEPGTYDLQWDVVQEGVAWLSEVSAQPPPSFRVQVVPWRPERAFSVLATRLGGLPVAGARLRARVELRNDGTMTWEPGGRVALAYHWRDENGEIEVWEGRRSPLPQAVAPGATVALRATVVLPDEPGRYLLQWDLVEERVAWFSEQDPSPQAPRPVRVLAPPPYGVVPAALALVLAVVLLVVRRGGGGLAVLAGADLVWIATSLLFKQLAVLHEAGRGFSDGGLLVAVAAAALPALLLLALPPRPRALAAWSVAAAASVLLLVDVVHLRYFGDVPSLATLGAAGQAAWVGASAAALLEGRDLWLVADLLPGALVVLVLAAHRRRAAHRRFVAAALVVLALPGLVTVARRLAARPASFAQVFQNLILVQENGPLAYHLVDAGTTLRGRLLRPPLSPERLALARQVFAERRALRAGVGPAFAAAAGANLLMLQVESLQSFVVGLEVEGTEITPHLNRLREQGLYLELYDQSAEGRTSDAELAVQASLLPLPSGAAVFRHPTNDYVGLADVLARSGYTTLAAVPFQQGFWNRRITYPAFGYGERLFADAFAPGERVGWGLSDADFLRQMLPRLERLERPFCAWLVTLSLHHPFTGFPPHLERLELGRWEGTPFAAYLETMHLFDRALGELLAGLAASGLDRDTVLVVYGDHDAGFGWERWLLPVLGLRHHHGDWYASDRVPLLVRLPQGVAAPAPPTVPAGHTDVAPTLLALLGGDPAAQAWIGRNLLGAPGAGPVVQPDGRWVDAGHLYAGAGRELEDGTCYDLATLLEVPVERCAEGFAAAARQRLASELVLAHDLQPQLSRPVTP